MAASWNYASKIFKRLYMYDLGFLQGFGFLKIFYDKIDSRSFWRRVFFILGGVSEIVKLIFS